MNIPTKEQLYQLYIVEQKSTVEISNIYSTHPNNISYWLDKYKIPSRSKLESVLLASQKGKMNKKRPRIKKNYKPHPNKKIIDENSLMNDIFNNNFNQQQLCKKYNISDPTLNMILLKNKDKILPLNKNDKLICKECGLYCFDLRKLSLHLSLKHNIRPNDYYDKYFKTENEGICNLEGCDCQTKFLSMVDGYGKHCSKKHANSNPTSKQNKINSMMEKYGVANSSQLPNHKERVEEKLTLKYGSPENHYKQRQLDIYKTKKKNNTFNTSKPEQQLYEILKKHYGDVKPQYLSPLYPYSCDFYIPSLNLYIELQASWTHGGYAFNPKNKDHIIQLKKYIEKSKTSSYYENAVHSWTILDVKKRQIALQNKLNYLEIFSFENEEDVLNQINSLLIP